MDSTAEQTPVELREARGHADAPTAEEWLRSGQVAERLGVHPRTVLRWAAAGLLPYGTTLGGQRRFPKAQVQALLARRCGQVAEEPGELLRTGEVARRLRVPARTVARWSRQGRLASVRTLGGHRRYPRAQVDDLHQGPTPTAAAERPSPGRGQRHDPAPVVIGSQAPTQRQAVVAHPRQAGLEIARTREP